MATRTNPFTFLQQVRAEAAKVTWPTRRETMISTLMVAAMAILAAIFFFTADQLMEAIRRVMKLVQAGRRSHTAGPANSQEAQFFKQQRDRFLKELANEYIRTRRTDERAMEVLEVLAEDPQCETRLLTALAMIYALNHRWSKLQALAARLTEQDTA